MDMGLVGKRVLVIEPSTGLEATVEVFAAEGEAAFVQGRDEACAQALAESIFDAGGRVQCDRVQRFIRRGGPGRDAARRLREAVRIGREFGVLGITFSKSRWKSWADRAELNPKADPFT